MAAWVCARQSVHVNASKSLNESKSMHDTQDQKTSVSTSFQLVSRTCLLQAVRFHLLCFEACLGLLDIISSRHRQMTSKNLFETSNHIIVVQNLIDFIAILLFHFFIAIEAKLIKISILILF